MEADAQVLQLEQALIRQAESLAREQRERAESGKARILTDASEKIRLAEEREVLSAKAEAERIVRRHSQAAETRLAAELDRLRWALTESCLSGVKLAFQELVDDDARYLAVLEQWFAAAIQAPGGEQAVQLKVAEKAVDAYGQLAQKNNTMIVPGHMGEVAGLIGTAMALMKNGKSA